MKYLGIDYGLKKIGLALSEGQVASVYKVIDTSSLKDSVEKVVQVIKDQNIEGIVIGVPDKTSAKKVNNFVTLLNKKIDQEKIKATIIKADETLSSYEARNLMIEMGTTKKDREKEDAYAAALILQNFLDTLN